MRNFINKFKIPTLLGLGLIFLGITSGVYLVLKDQIFFSKAAPDLTPQNVVISNISDSSAVVSWQTNSESPSFITFGQNSPTEQTALDDRDSSPKPHLIHYLTLKNLLPKTGYQFKIISGKTSSDIFKFETASPLNEQAGYSPIIGSILQENNTPLDEGVAYLSITDATTQSALIKKGGNFLIPLSSIRKNDLSGFSLTENMTGKITINSPKGRVSLLITLRANSTPLPPAKLGQDLDLTVPEETPTPTPQNTADKYDLNGDKQINSADYSTITSCINKPLTIVLPGNIHCAKTDLNGDGKIDQADLDLMSQKLKGANSQ